MDLNFSIPRDGVHKSREPPLSDQACRQTGVEETQQEHTDSVHQAGKCKQVFIWCTEFNILFYLITLLKLFANWNYLFVCFLNDNGISIVFNHRPYKFLFEIVRLLGQGSRSLELDVVWVKIVLGFWARLKIECMV